MLIDGAVRGHVVYAQCHEENDGQTARQKAGCAIESLF